MVSTCIAGTSPDRYLDVIGLPRRGGPAPQLSKEN